MIVLNCDFFYCLVLCLKSRHHFYEHYENKDQILRYIGNAKREKIRFALKNSLQKSGKKEPNRRRISWLKNLKTWFRTTRTGLFRAVANTIMIARIANIRSGEVLEEESFLLLKIIVKTNAFLKIFIDFLKLKKNPNFMTEMWLSDRFSAFFFGNLNWPHISTNLAHNKTIAISKIAYW